MHRSLTTLVAAAALAGCSADVLQIQIEGDPPEWLDEEVALAAAIFDVEVERVDFAGVAVAFVPGMHADKGLCGSTQHWSATGSTTLCHRVIFIDPECEGVFAHELGHALQLDHEDDPENVMWGERNPGEGLTDAQAHKVRRATRYLDWCQGVTDNG